MTSDKLLVWPPWLIFSSVIHSSQWYSQSGGKMPVKAQPLCKWHAAVFSSQVLETVWLLLPEKHVCHHYCHHLHHQQSNNTRPWGIYKVNSNYSKFLICFCINKCLLQQRDVNFNSVKWLRWWEFHILKQLVEKIYPGLWATISSSMFFQQGIFLAETLRDLYMYFCHWLKWGSWRKKPVLGRRQWIWF